MWRRKPVSPAVPALLAASVLSCGVAMQIVCPTPPQPAGKPDPIFGKATPILFAHRGGAVEAPESTEMAFCHAVRHSCADVLELDVQLTRDKRFVVWHGPKLDNVFIADQPSDPRQRGRRRIWQYDWDELDGKAWVADPTPPQKTAAPLRDVPHVAQRKLMLLETFLTTFPCEPLNIELKSSVEVDDLPRFIRILDAAPRCPGQTAPRPVLVVSLSQALVSAFRAHQCCYPTGYSIVGNLATVSRTWFVPFPDDMRGRALQTSEIWLHDAWGRQVVGRVHADHGAVHVFISSFLGHSLDEQISDENSEGIRALLGLGVDGLMTDRPRWVRTVIGSPAGRPPCPGLEGVGGHDEHGRCLACVWNASEPQGSAASP
jgi:glycerophosphoryl diester phosphodiesterase